MQTQNKRTEAAAKSKASGSSGDNAPSERSNDTTEQTHPARTPPNGPTAGFQITKTELVWPGKYNPDGTRKEVPRVNLPFQVIETINESRATREGKKGVLPGLFDVWEGKEGDTFEAGWKNKLIWGDNLLVMGSLLEKFAGKIDLIYVDPPFATGLDFSFRTQVGGGEMEIEKEQSMIEEKAYRDTWGQGLQSYLEMIHQRIVLMRDLLSDRGSFYIHLDPTMSHLVKSILDEVFGIAYFHSEIIWRRSNSHNKLTGQFGPIHDSILFYSKGSEYKFHPGTRPFSKGYIEARFVHKDRRGIYQPNYLTGPGIRSGDSGKPWHGFDPTSKGRHWAIPSRSIELLGANIVGLTTQQVLDLLLEKDLLVIPKKQGGQPMYKQYLTEGVPYQDLWTYVANSAGYLYGTDECIDQDVKWLEQEPEKLGYETQKPEGLLKRIIETSTDPGDLVADLFSGSGTAPAVAEKTGRRWIGCDLSRWSIHTCRKRLLEIQNCKPFEVLNLGKYERKYWQGITFSDAKKKRGQQLAIFQYIAFILKLYGAQPLTGMQHLHGKKSKALVHIGAVDAPVTIDEINACIEECLAVKQSELHVLGWEWEMGLANLMVDEAKKRGVKLLLLNIPREVMEQQAVDKGDIRFFEVAHLEVKINEDKGHKVSVELKDFAFPYADLIPDEVRGKIKKWSDYIDYWAVDWSFQNDTFMNGWVAYRTRKERKLALESDSHSYEKPGNYTIMVKVVDIFGNDTSQSFEAEVK